MNAEEVEKEEEEEEKDGLSVWDCGSPLYDSYELVSISHLIERHLMTLSSIGGSKPFITSDHLSEPSLSNMTSPNMDSELSTKSVNRRSSMMTSLSEFMRRKVWKRKRVFGDQRKDKPKKLKTGISGFCNKIGLWKNN